MKRFIKIIFIIIYIILIIPFILYFFQFSGTLSQDVNDWNCFSALLSASIGTIISATTLLILLIDRKKSDYEKKTNQFIDYLYRQNDAITKNFVSCGIVEIPIEQKFGDINAAITEEYCNTVIFNYINTKSLTNCPKIIQDYIIFGFCYSRKQTQYITVDYFDNKLSEHWKRQAIANAHNRSLKIKEQDGYSEHIIVNSSNIQNNIEVLEILNLPYDKSILKKLFDFSNLGSKYPYSIVSFINTYRYALTHILDYNEGISLYFSQLSLEQKIFVAFDIISMDNQEVYSKLKKNNKLLSELITKEVKNRNKLIEKLYINC